VCVCVCVKTYESFFVVSTVWNTAGDHVEVDFIIVGLVVDGGDHVVGGRREVVFVSAEFLAGVFVIKAVEKAC